MVSCASCEVVPFEKIKKKKITTKHIELEIEDQEHTLYPFLWIWTFPGGTSYLLIWICLHKREDTDCAGLHEANGRSHSVCRLAVTKEASQQGSRNFSHKGISSLSHSRLRSSEAWKHKDLSPFSCSCWKKTSLSLSVFCRLSGE